MRYGDVCTGIGAATVAWHGLGWEPVFFSEIAKFPRAVLKHHYPGVPLHGDFTTIKQNEYGPIDLLAGGTPCQSFSVAGLRKGMADERGNLALEFLKLAQRLRPRWLVWENVPGVLSSTGHDAPDPCPPPPPVGLECGGKEVETEDQYSGEEVHAFNSFLAGLSKIGYRFSYRVLDAQFFGVPQRRKRVFVVGYLGNWRPAAAVLFERPGSEGNPPTGDEKGPVTSARTAGGVGKRGADDNTAQEGHLIVVNAEGDAGPPFLTACNGSKGINNQTPLVVAPPLTTRPYGDNLSREDMLIVTNLNQLAGPHNGSNPKPGDPAPTLSAKDRAAIFHRDFVRRLTPLEFERLQGFPDGYTLIPGYETGLKRNIADNVAYFQEALGMSAEEARAVARCPDGPRYEAIGNSMAVPVMRWIGERISLVEEIMNETNEDQHGI